MSDRPGDQESETADAGRATPGSADEPVTGAPAGASGSPAAPASPAFSPGSSSVPDPASSSARGPAESQASSAAGSRASSAAGSRAPGATAAPGPRTYRTGIRGWFRQSKRTGPPGEKERGRRRWVVAGISIGAAVIVIVICASALAIVSAFRDDLDRDQDAREARRVRDGECLSLEQRLNRLVPPGATGSPQARAVAVRDENSAVRIYVTELRDQRSQDGWRQLLDARTAYAEALDLQAKSRTPAFYVPPRTPDGRAVTDELVDRSAPPCAGPIRRLAVPDL